jgi:hypothetical protein
VKRFVRSSTAGAASPSAFVSRSISASLAASSHRAFSTASTELRLLGRRRSGLGQPLFGRRHERLVGLHEIDDLLSGFDAFAGIDDLDDFHAPAA